MRKIYPLLDIDTVVSFSRFIACSMMLVSKYSSGNIISSVCSDKCITPVLVNGIILNSSIDENNIGLKSFNNKLANSRISSNHSIQYLSGVTTSSNTTITFPISEISIKSDSIHGKEVFIKDDIDDGLDGILKKAKEMMGEEEFYELVECNEYNTVRDKIVLDTIRSDEIDLDSLVSNGISVLGDSERDRLERVVWYDVDDSVVTDTDTVLYSPIERPTASIRPVTYRKRDYIRKWFKWW